MTYVKHFIPGFGWVVGKLNEEKGTVEPLCTVEVQTACSRLNNELEGCPGILTVDLAPDNIKELGAAVAERLHALNQPGRN